MPTFSSKDLPTLALACGVLLQACARQEPAEEPVVEDTLAVAEAPPGISLADVAGTWEIQSVSEAGDTVRGQLVATAEPSGWMLHLPDRAPVPVRIISVDGDSIVTEAGPFESVIRPGIQVRTQTTYRLQGDRLVGSIVARYETTEPDSVVRLQQEGTRAP